MTRPFRKFFSDISSFWLLILDGFLVCLAFLSAFRIRFGHWDIAQYGEGLTPALLISMTIYLTSMTAGGLYRMQPRTMHLKGYLRVAVSLLVAWVVSVTAVFLVHPAHMPPRSVTAVQLMLSMIGVLGLRAVIRYWIELKALPDELLPGAAWPPPVRTFSIHDVIDREPVLIDHSALRDYLSSRTVLVTGAGGSVGASLCNLLLELRTFRLVLVDNSEYNLFQLEKDLRKHPYRSELEFRIADVREEDMMRPLFTNFRPDIIFHAAAYKHVPLMERHPIEAFHNNTMATVGLLRLCEEFETEQFIFISTDKSVSPSSVLGATKRLAEWYVRAATHPVERKIIRFGNVFGSQGSVVPLFREQIEAGGPVTITHPDMERFFISADEACGLVLQTLLFTTPASTYMLRMEPSIPIQYLAQRMIERLNPYPNRAIEILFTGVRPGEKMFERLMNDEEEQVATPHHRIIGLKSLAPFSRAELDAILSHLEYLCVSNQTEALRKALFQTDFEFTLNGTAKGKPRS